MFKPKIYGDTVKNNVQKTQGQLILQQLRYRTGKYINRDLN